jgi:hypothetical protein
MTTFMSLGVILIYGCACVIIQKRAHLCTCITVSLPNTDGSLSAHFTVFRTNCFRAIIIVSGKGDIGADEPEDKMMKVLCQLKNCRVSWAGE